MKAIRKNVEIVKLFTKNSAVYRADIVGSAVLFSVYIFVFTSLWRYMGSDVQIAGYSLKQMIWYLVCTEFIMVACRTDIFFKITAEVKNGNIAYSINRPVNYISYNILACLGGNLISTIIYTIISILLGILLSASFPPIALSKIIPFIFSLILGILIQLFIQLCIGLSALYFGESTAINLIYQKLVFLLGGVFPTAILPEWLENLSNFLPFQYIAGVPARLLVSFSWPSFFQLVLVQAIYLVLIVLFAILLTKHGKRKLQIYGG